MNCPEYLRLLEEYEAAHRRWGLAMFSQVEEQELRLKAHHGRSAAKRKLYSHRESCPTCKGESLADRTFAS
jgi:hypothetical protein